MPTPPTCQVLAPAGAAPNCAVSVEFALVTLAWFTTKSTGVFTVKLVPTTRDRPTLAVNGPYADTLPKFSVAALVPAPLDNGTPAPSLLNTRVMELVNWAWTVSVPLAVV